VKDHPLPRHIAPRTLPALLEKWAVLRAGRVGIIARAGDKTYHELTWDRWFQQTVALATHLVREFGVGKGDKVAWMLGNEYGLQALLLHHAITRVGAVSVPVNTRLTAPEVAYILDHSDAVVVFHPPEQRQAVAAYLDSAPACRTVEVRPGIGEDEFRRLLDPVDDPLPVAEIDDEDEAIILYTSGTTASPKGVVHTHGSAIAVGVAVSDLFMLNQEDRLQAHFPVFTGGGMHFNGMAALWAGATYVVDDFHTRPSLQLLHDSRATVCVAVPSVYQFWLEQPDFDAEHLPNLRILDYGGASMAASVIEQLRERLPGIDLMQSYGLTEGGPGGVYLAGDYCLRKLGSVGNRGFGPYTRFRVVDEHGNDVGPDRLGELIIRGPSVMKEYYKDPGQTSAAIRAGWLHTGDLVRVDSDGFLFHVDRMKDIVVRGGFNISSAEVESVLVSHPDVLEAAVVGKPHPKLGEDLRAYVILRDGAAPDVEGLRSYARERLADFKCPRDIVVRDRMPRNATGKVLKRELRAEAAQEGNVTA
jgi:acyl-CoA synthetase (AMP-forming)/AMP-acid ligase II